MDKQYDFKNEWKRTKQQLSEISQGALKVAQKGKLQVDIAALNLKKEHLYHLIGKEYVQSGEQSIPSEKLRQLLKEFREIDKEQQAIKMKLGRSDEI